MDGTRSFAEVQKESLRFFHNAFSVLSDLLYMPSGLMAVQALTVMVSLLERLSGSRIAEISRPPSRSF